MSHRRLLYLILSLLGLASYTDWPFRLFNFASFILAAAAILGRSNRLARLAILTIFTTLLVFAAQYGPPVRDKLASVPGDTYTTDMRGFLKTYYLMKTGTGFHKAFEIGITGSLGSFSLDLAGWREPFIFHLWTSLPGNATSIYFLWIMMLIAVIFAAYRIAQKFLPDYYAVLSPLLLLPYLLYSLSDLAMLQPEWWGFAFLIIGLMFYFYHRYFAAGVVFAICLATREMYFIPIASVLAVSVFKNGYRSSLKMTLPIIGFILYYVFYYLPPILSVDQGLVKPIRMGYPIFMNQVLAYSMWSYQFGALRPFLWVGIATTALLIIQAVKSARKRLVCLELLALYVPTIIALFAIGAVGRMTQWHDYWGIYFVPLLIIVTPIALATFLQTLSQE